MFEAFVSKIATDHCDDSCGCQSSHSCNSWYAQHLWVIRRSTSVHFDKRAQVWSVEALIALRRSQRNQNIDQDVTTNNRMVIHIRRRFASTTKFHTRTSTSKHTGSIGPHHPKRLGPNHDKTWLQVTAKRRNNLPLDDFKPQFPYPHQYRSPKAKADNLLDAPSWSPNYNLQICPRTKRSRNDSIPLTVYQ